MPDFLTYRQNLEKLCCEKSFLLSEIGSIGPNRLPLLKILINPQAQGKTICFAAGVHGNEIAGPLSIPIFLAAFKPEQFPDLKIIIFPVINPTGFEKVTRRNHLRLDLNRHFCRPLPSGEVRLVLIALKSEKIYFFHSLHEDLDENSFYLYNFEKSPQKIYPEIISLAEKSFPINRESKIYSDQARSGLITNIQDGSFEDRMFRNGVPFSMCTETPGQKPLADRISLNLKIIKKVLQFAKRAVSLKQP